MSQIWGAPVARQVGHPMPDCRKCKDPEFAGLRERWGCDRPTETPVFKTSCGCGFNPKCPRCKGSNEVKHYRCPTMTMNAHGPEARSMLGMAIEAYVAYDAHGVLPTEGAWDNQAATWAEFVQVIESERGVWEKILHDHFEHQRKQAQRASKAKAAAAKSRRK